MTAAQLPYGLAGTVWGPREDQPNSPRLAEASVLASTPTVKEARGVQVIKIEIDRPTPNRILCLRVGIDTGCVRALGALFADGSFESVPIPEPLHLAGDAHLLGCVRIPGW